MQGNLTTNGARPQFIKASVARFSKAMVLKKSFCISASTSMLTFGYLLQSAEHFQAGCSTGYPWWKLR